MSPYYSHGDFLFILKFFPFFLIKTGRDIVFQHTRYGRMIKRISKVDRVNRVVRAEGFDPNSITEEQIGDIPLSSIEGIGLFKIS